MEKELFSERIPIERKNFTFDLRENARGRFLKIIEDVGGRRDAVIIPVSGLQQVREIIDHALKADQEAGSCTGEQ
ncbi:MAG: DNA-binding protein [Verrucomicrobiota bacterium]